MGLISRVSSRTYRLVMPNKIKELFSPTDPKKLIREQQREMRKQNRVLERDRRAMDRDEQKIKTQLKTAAKNNDKAKSHQMSAQLSSVGIQMKNMQATQTMANSMAASTSVMGKMNAKMNPQKVNKQMMNFARENEKFDMTQEMMNDAMDDAFAVDSGEE